MRSVTVGFWKERVRDLLQQDGIDTPKTWRRLALFLFLKPGLLTQVLLPYLAYYLPGFHPWRHDDRKLAKAIEQGLQLNEAL